MLLEIQIQAVFNFLSETEIPLNTAPTSWCGRGLNAHHIEGISVLPAAINYQNYMIKY
jgi:hypothetical protein